MDGIKQKATLREIAERAVKEALRHECDPVPCPQCAKFQEDMIAVLLESERDWGDPTIPLLLAIPCIAGLVFTLGRLEIALWLLLFAISIPGLCVWLAVVFTREKRHPNDPRGHLDRLKVAKERAIVGPDLDLIRQPEKLMKELTVSVYPELRTFVGNWQPPKQVMGDPAAARREARRIFLARIDEEPVPLWDEEKERVADEFMAMAFPNAAG